MNSDGMLDGRMPIPWAVGSKYWRLVDRQEGMTPLWKRKAREEKLKQLPAQRQSTTGVQVALASVNDGNTGKQASIDKVHTNVRTFTQSPAPTMQGRNLIDDRGRSNPLKPVPKDETTRPRLAGRRTQSISGIARYTGYIGSRWSATVM